MDAGKLTIYEAALDGDYELVRWIVEYSRSSLNEFANKHRTALHFAAISGDPEIFEYLIDRCGLDPLSGDEDLVTPWDIVHFIIHAKDDEESKRALQKTLNTIEYAGARNIETIIKKSAGHKEIEKFLELKYSHPYEDFYRNPIRSGFFPDPSICRVGDDYYMVNSSFIFFPCIPISHSKDLVHWEIIGHAITDPKWAYLDDLEGGRGYWAPDISYYEGKFNIAATYRLNDTGPVFRRQMVVYSDKPEGPYSEPVFIDEDGIDPGFFNDDDGRRYMLLNRGARIFELDKTGTKKISDARLLYYGSNKRAPEGPHIYKKDGYYYLLQAEGGTGPGHRVTVARSKSLMGIYEPCPYNPIMRQNDEEATIQRCGHGDLVETPDGRWYMVYLCGRKIGDGYSILGRETALDPVVWTCDGWPIVNNLKGPSCMQVKPYPVYETTRIESYKEKSTGICTENNKESNMVGHGIFSPCGLPLDYMTPRSFEKGDIVCHEDRDYRYFEIMGSREPFSSTDARNLILTRQTSFVYNYSVFLEIPDLEDGQSAGITGFYDENTFLLFGIRNKAGNNYIFLKQHIGDENIEKEQLITASKSTKYLKLTMDTDFLRRSFYYHEISDMNDAKGKADYKDKGIMFDDLTNVYYLCDEGLKRGKRFTGALCGMFVYGGKRNNKKVCFFIKKA